MFRVRINRIPREDSAAEPTESVRPEESHVYALVQSARKGQKDAFDEIIFLYREQVFSAAWQLTRNWDDAMDVSQEALVRAYKALGSYSGKSRFSTWLHRITLNTAIDYLRREKRHRHDSIEFPGADNTSQPVKHEGSVSANQRETVFAAELQKEVRQALGQLSARQREVFILRYYHELDIREISKVLKCTDGSVKRHLFRAQSRLKELLRDSGLQNYGQ